MNTFKFLSYAFSSIFCLLILNTATAQNSVRISSKAQCASTVEVTWLNPTVLPATQSTIVNVPAYSVVTASCPSCTGPDWNLCFFEVSFADGSGFIHPGDGCNVTEVYTGPFDCFNDNSGSYEPGDFAYYYEP